MQKICMLQCRLFKNNYSITITMFIFSDNNSKAFWYLWKYCRDEINATIKDSESFRLKARIIGKNSNAANTRDVEIAMPLKHNLKYLKYL